MSGSCSDTGAREPHDQRLLREAADWLHQRAKESPVPAGMGAWVDAIDRAALAAGVGVPPPAEKSLEANSADYAEVRARAERWLKAGSALNANVQVAAGAQLARDVVALLKEVEELRAGVGEARPAEPPATYQEATVLRLSTELVRLREQLDAARQALERGENDWCFLFNLNDHVPLAPEVRRALATANLKLIRAARAAFGVGDSRPDLGGALDQRAVETRGGES